MSNNTEKSRLFVRMWEEEFPIGPYLYGSPELMNAMNKQFERMDLHLCFVAMDYCKFKNITSPVEVANVISQAEAFEFAGDLEVLGEILRNEDIGFMHDEHRFLETFKPKLDMYTEEEFIRLVEEGYDFDCCRSDYETLIIAPDWITADAHRQLVGSSENVRYTSVSFVENEDSGCNLASNAEKVIVIHDKNDDGIEFGKEVCAFFKEVYPDLKLYVGLPKSTKFINDLKLQKDLSHFSDVADYWIAPVSELSEEEEYEY